MLKITKKEIKELIAIYDIVRTFLDMDGETECINSLYKRIYINGFDNSECKPIHAKMTRFIDEN